MKPKVSNKIGFVAFSTSMENFMAFISKYEYKSVVTKDRHTSSTKKYLELLPLPEYIKDDLNLLFIGINPGIQSSLKQHYYANPINHFWKCIYESGLVPEKVDCTKEEHLLHKYSIGMINYIERPSRSVSEISQQEFNSGRQRIERLLNRYKPKVICFNGKKPYLSFFNSQKADYGQQESIKFENGKEAKVFLMPSTSPRVRKYQKSDKIKFLLQLKNLINI